MSGLRWILLAAGIVFIAFVYLFTRYQQERRGASVKTATDKTTRFGLHSLRDQENDAPDVENELTRISELVSERRREPVLVLDNTGRTQTDPKPEQQLLEEEKLVVLSIMAPGDRPFAGRALLNAFEHTGLKYGDMSIYHRLPDQGISSIPVFSVASAVKPGTFNPADMEEYSTPGLSLFLQLPGPVRSVDAFDDLVNTAERLAVELGGEMRDQEQKAVSHQMLMQVRQQIVQARSGAHQNSV